MLKTDFNINFNGTSADNDGNTICTFNANTMGNSVNISKNIMDIENYMTNKEIADADFIAFEQKIFDAIEK